MSDTGENVVIPDEIASMKDKVTYGSEPFFKHEPSLSEMAMAFTWYKNIKDAKDAKEWTISLVTKLNLVAPDQLVILNNTPEDRFIPIGWTSRLLLKGSVVLSTSKKYLIRRIKELIENPYSPPEEVESFREEKTPRISIIIAMMEQELQKLLAVPMKNTKFNPREYYEIKELTKAELQEILGYFIDLSEEFQDVLKVVDKEISKQYLVIYPPNQILKISQFLQKILSDARELILEKKKPRKITIKPKKKKALDLNKMVSKLSYLRSEDKYNITSIDPKTIIGASSLWIFNTKTRKLTVLNAAKDQTLTIKGTSILNYDEKTSVTKTLRKPEEILPKVLTDGKIVLKTLLTQINAQAIIASGRINNETLLLRAIK